MKKQLVGILTAAAIAVMGSFAVYAEETQEIPVIGSDASGQEFGCVMENGTEQEITGVALRINYGEFTENLLTEGVTFAPGEKVHLYCTPGEMVNYVPAVYDLQVTYADETTGTMHTLPMGDTEAIVILTGKQETEAAEEEAETENGEQADDGMVTYIRFTSLSLGYEMDTLRKETEIAGLGEAFLKADYENKTTYTGGGGGSWDGGNGGGGNGGGDNGGGNACLDDAILF